MDKCSGGHDTLDENGRCHLGPANRSDEPPPVIEQPSFGGAVEDGDPHGVHVGGRCFGVQHAWRQGRSCVPCPAPSIFPLAHRGWPEGSGEAVVADVAALVGSLAAVVHQVAAGAGEFIRPSRHHRDGEVFTR